MSIEICLRKVDQAGELLWEGKITHFNEYLWRFPEYREMAMAQAARMLGRKLDQHEGRESL